MQNNRPIFKEGMDRIGKMIAERYKQDPSFIQGMVKAFPSIRMALSEVYTLRRNIGLCEDIAKLQDKDKLELWAEAKKWTDEKDKQILHQVCKSIIAIGSYL